MKTTNPEKKDKNDVFNRLYTVTPKELNIDNRKDNKSKSPMGKSKNFIKENRNMDKIRQSNESKMAPVDLTEFSKKDSNFADKNLSKQSSCSTIKHETSLSDV